MSAPASPRARQPTAPKVRLRSLDEVDRRFGAAQAAFQLRADLEADMGAGERLSTAEKQLIEHAAVLGAMLRDLGARYLSGEMIDTTVYLALGNGQRRVLEALGLQRRPVDVSPPSLAAYLREKEAAA